jgi:hypothetical protein
MNFKRFRIHACVQCLFLFAFAFSTLVDGAAESALVPATDRAQDGAIVYCAADKP